MKSTGHGVIAIALLLMAAHVTHGQETEQSRNTDFGRQKLEAQKISAFRSKNWTDRTKVWPKHWYKDWQWWVGIAVIGGLEVADSYSTIAGLERCPQCQETNPLIGPHPTKGKIIAYTSVGFGVKSVLHVLSWKACPDVNRRSQAWHISCNALVPGIGAGLVIPHVLHNFSLIPRTTATSLSASISQKTELSRIPGNELVLPKRFSGCGQSLTLCIPSPGLDASAKIDLRGVRLRRD